MQKHTNRLIVAAVLIAAAAIGGVFVFTAHQRTAVLDTAANDVASRIDRMIATAGDIASAEQAYVAPGQPDQPWLDRGAMLLQQFGQDAAAIRPLLQSPDASALADVEKTFKSIVAIDGRVREELQQEQNLLAADLIFSEGHDTVAGLVMALRNLDAFERQTVAAQRASVEREQWAALGGVAVIWAAGLLMLVPVRAGSGMRLAPSEVEGDPGSVTRGPLNPEPPDARSPSTSLGASRIPDRGHVLLPNPGVVPSTVDLAVAADVCGAFARTADTAALREALARAAAVLDARGIVVWMGAGEELFPALSHGYDERVVERLGPIPRDAANATAEAWRTARIRTVASNQMFDGALAAPIVGVNGCIGVFAAEVRHAREEDAATRAVATMIAAQLAGILPAWPAASGATEKADSAPLAASNG